MGAELLDTENRAKQHLKRREFSPSSVSLVNKQEQRKKTICSIQGWY